MTRRFWPNSLLGQMMLAAAAALLLAQAIGAMLLYRAQAERREAALAHVVAFRLLAALPEDGRAGAQAQGIDRAFGPQGRSGLPVESEVASPLRAGETRMRDAEDEVRRFLAGQAQAAPDVVVILRAVRDDPVAWRRLVQRARAPHLHLRAPPRHVMVAGLRRPGDGRWLVARVFLPGGDPMVIATLMGQTALIYLVLVGAIAFILSRITRPLAALTRRLERFSAAPNPLGQLKPEGPDDVRRLIVAHNAMEARISALLDEKDVMLGAIGHDLKTPLSALRVRIESVENESERARMAATIEDIARSLDDILSLARVGRPSDPCERAELSALVASVVEEFEDMGEPVELVATRRIVLPLRATWLRRAIRNLVGNALRYGGTARVAVGQEGTRAVIRVDDDGPGIPDGAIARMLEPFTRGEPSRNTETGGAGLGLTLARAIAEQHGGALSLANRRGPGGAIEGLTVTLALPLG